MRPIVSPARFGHHASSIVHQHSTFNKDCRIGWTVRKEVFLRRHRTRQGVWWVNRGRQSIPSVSGAQTSHQQLLEQGPTQPSGCAEIGARREARNRRVHHTKKRVGECYLELIISHFKNRSINLSQLRFSAGKLRRWPTWIISIYRSSSLMALTTAWRYPPRHCCARPDDGRSGCMVKVEEKV